MIIYIIVIITLWRCSDKSLIIPQQCHVYVLMYPIITVPESVDVLLGVLHHLLELVGAGDLGRGLEVGPVLLAQPVLLKQVPLQPRVHLQPVPRELVRPAVLLGDDLVVLLHVWNLGAKSSLNHCHVAKCGFKYVFKCVRVDGSRNHD